MLRIISDTPVNEEHMLNTIHLEFDQQKDDIHHALKRLMVKMIALAVLGVAILSLWLYLSATSETVGIEILSIMGWVCVWEATSIAVLQQPELRGMWLNIERLTRSKIIFQIAEEPQEAAAEQQQ